MEIVGHKVMHQHKHQIGEVTKTLDWYDIIPHFGDESNNCDRKILYKFYDVQFEPKILGENLVLKLGILAHGGLVIREYLILHMNQLCIYES